MNSHDLREKFFNYFIKQGHTKVASSSLIPAEDPTLLFANAGMNQFKDLFLGKEKRSYNRAVSIQKCIRAGGKHNDLENVGFTKRHLTFFEMMGNFSFGDYFKKDAIRFAWDFLVHEIGLDQSKLYASVYYKDDEAYDIWHTEIGLPKERIVRLGEADNFWQMGDVGPCGPCTEIYIDRGEAYGTGPDNSGPGSSGDRFLEIWNLVFMQYDRSAQGDKPLSQTGVDTGMGLERLCAVVQDKESIYETDLFAPVLAKIEQLTGIQYDSTSQEIKAAFRVLADHLRSSSFAIADGCTPSNEGRGYVLRKIIRRAALFAQKLSSDNIFPQLVPALTHQMGGIYPELKINEQQIISLLTSEIEKFSQNLLNGQQILAKYFDANKAEKIISGNQAFKLYDTYGFPLELTKMIAAEKGYSVDLNGFDAEMEQQRLQSGKKVADTTTIELDPSIKTEFVGYTKTEVDAPIIGLIVDNKQVDSVKAGEFCGVIAQLSPFYVESGGQINDEGTITIDGKSSALAGLKKIGSTIVAFIQAPADMHVGQMISQQVSVEKRTNTMKNHTATHLLQAALLKVIGKTIKQSGSVVTPDYLRFDFTHHESLTADQIKQVEKYINDVITRNIPVTVTQTTLKDAVSRGVIAFFGEKYNPENVRVVEIPGVSAELCGGTHVHATGDIGTFKITEILALSAGNRRIVALTGPKAIETYQDVYNTIKSLAQDFKTIPDKVIDAIEKQKTIVKNLQTELKNLKKQMVKHQISNWTANLETIKDIPFGYIALEETPADELKDIAQELLKAKPAFYMLVAKGAIRNSFALALSPQFESKVNFKNLTLYLKELGLQGGGSGNIILGGAQKINSNLADIIKNWLVKNN